MAFDLASAEPVAPASGGFDLASATPVETVAHVPGTGDNIPRAPGENPTPTPQPPAKQGWAKAADVAIGPLDALRSAIGKWGMDIPGYAPGNAPKTQTGQKITDVVSQSPVNTEFIQKVLPAVVGHGGELNTMSELGIPQVGVRKTEVPRVPPADHPKVAIPNSLIDQGLKLTPSMTQNQSRVGRLLEGIGGKAQTRQLMSQKNEPIINEMAAKDLGLEPGTPITETTVKPILDKYSGIRSQIDSIKKEFVPDDELKSSVSKIAGDQMVTWAHRKQDVPPAFKELLDIVGQETYTPKYLQAEARILRGKAKDNLTKSNGDTQLGTAQKETANALENFLERQIQTTNPDLIKQFQDARKMTAKVYDYLEVTNELGDVNAIRLAKLGETKPLSGEAKTIATLGGVQPKAAQPSSVTGGYQPHSAFDTAAAAGSLMAGKPSGALEFIGVRPASREILASKYGQNKFVRPDTTPKTTIRPEVQAPRVVTETERAVVPVAVANMTKKQKRAYDDAEKERKYQEWKKKQRAEQ
jgi:hypothetical protein